MDRTEEIIKYKEKYEAAIFGLMFHGCQHLTVTDARGIMTAIENGKVPNVNLDELLNKG